MSKREAQKRFVRGWFSVRGVGWSDRWKVLRDEGGGYQGNALPTSAYFSSARALGSIQHHREFPDQTHPLDNRPSRPRRQPTPPTSIPFSPFAHRHCSLDLLPLDDHSSLSLFPFVSRLPSGSFPLCSAVSLLFIQPAPATLLSVSPLFAECTRFSLSGLVSSPFSLSVVLWPSRLCPAWAPRCSDRKNYRTIFGGSSWKTIARPVRS